MAAGVYKITNGANGKFYIGSSSNTVARFCSHRSLLNKGTHPNLKLQNAWNKYGPSSFTFETIEKCENVIEREQYWIDTLKPWYNIRTIAESNQGIKIKVSQKRIDANRRNNVLRGQLTAQKCLIYHLDGSFKQECVSYMEADKVCGVARGLARRLSKSTTGKCGSYRVRPYVENYQKQI